MGKLVENGSLLSF
jgi:hypothetical protein